MYLRILQVFPLFADYNQDGGYRCSKSSSELLYCREQTRPEEKEFRLDSIVIVQ